MNATVSDTGTGTEKIVGSSLTIIGEYSQIAADVAELERVYGGLVIDVSTPAGLKAGKKGLATLVTCRTTLENARKEINKPLAARKLVVDDEAKRITVQIVKLEEGMRVQIQAEDNRLQAIVLAAAMAEQERQDECMAIIDIFRSAPEKCVGKPAVVIEGKIVELLEVPLHADDLGEHYATACDAQLAAITKLKAMADERAAMDEQKAELAKQAEELRQARAEIEQYNAEKVARELEQAREITAKAEAAAKVEREAAEEAAKVRGYLIKKIQAMRQPFAFGVVVSWDQCAELLSKAEDIEITTAEFGDLYEDAKKAQAQAIELIGTRMDVIKENEEEAEAKAIEDARIEAVRVQQAETKRQLDAQQASIDAAYKAAAKQAEADRKANLGLREAAQAIVDLASGSRTACPALWDLIDDLATALSNEPGASKRAANAHMKKVAK